MQKKNLRKLTLNRETLRQLGDPIREAAGNGPDPSYQYSQCNTCGILCPSHTCDRTCGTCGS